jgi:hypothetical protein
MEDQLPQNLMESINTLPGSMEGANVDVWTKINDNCFITPAIDRLNSLQDKGFFERREKALDDRGESVDNLTPGMSPTPFANSPLPAEAQPAADSSPTLTTSQPHDPVVERIEEILGVVGVHEIILGEQVAGTISLLEKTMAHVRRLHEQALHDITYAAQALCKLRHDLTRVKPPFMSPCQDEVTPNSASNDPSYATSVRPVHTSHEVGPTVVAPAARVAPATRVAPEHDEDSGSSVPTVLVDNKQSDDKRRGEGVYSNSNSGGSQHRESSGFAAHAQHQPGTRPSVHEDGSLASPTNVIFSTGSDGQYPPSAEQKQPDVDDLRNKHQRPMQRHGEEARGMHDKHTAASDSKAPHKKTSRSTPLRITTTSNVNSRSRDTAFSPTSSVQSSSNNATRLFTPVSPPSGCAQPYIPDLTMLESVRSSEKTPQSILHPSAPLLDAHNSTLDEEDASIHQAPSDPPPIVKHSNVRPTKGIKRSSDSTLDLGSKRTRQRTS